MQAIAELPNAHMGYVDSTDSLSHTYIRGNYCRTFAIPILMMKLFIKIFVCNLFDFIKSSHKEKDDMYHNQQI